MKKAVCYLTLFLLLIIPQTTLNAREAADKQDALKIAKKLMDLVVAGPFIENMAKSTWGPTENILRSKNSSITDEQIAALKDTYVKIQKEYMDELLVGMPQIYAKHFTAKEMQQLYDFQISPIGKKSLKVTPQIMQELMPKIMIGVQKMGPKLQEEFKKIVKKKGLKI